MAGEVLGVSACLTCEVLVAAAEAHGHHLVERRQRGRPRGVTPCSVDGCERRRASPEGFCDSHAKRWRKFGTTERQRGPAQHGTRSMYNKGCRCALCAEAQLRGCADGRKERTERARRDPSLVPHSAAAYSNWGCRCEVCCTAAAEKRRREEASRHRRAATDAPHGTMSGYVNWSCRCDPCREAARVVCRRRYAKRGKAA
jgi:hypothetical protein